MKFGKTNNRRSAHSYKNTKNTLSDLRKRRVVESGT